MKHPFTRCHYLTLLCLLLVGTLADGRTNSTLNPPVGEDARAKNLMQQPRPLSFTENKGQVRDQQNNPRSDIQFKLAATGGLNIFIGEGAVHYQFYKANSTSMPHRDVHDKPGQVVKDTTSYSLYRMDVELVNANKHAVCIPSEQQEYVENYFTTGTGEQAVVAKAYNKITYKDVYPHIDWVLYTRNGMLKHEFVVRTGGNIADIQLRYGGAKQLKINNDGSLLASTPQGNIAEQAPYCYGLSDNKKIGSSYVLRDSIVSYSVANHTGDIVIDPGVIWSTYTIGDGYDMTYGIATDPFGGVFITGEIDWAYGFATVGAYQVDIGGVPYVGFGLTTYDAYLMKFSGSGTLLWATYYGGSGVDWGRDVATDASGNVYIVGLTESPDHIATPGAHKVAITMSPYEEAFLAKFNSAGALQWATYFGESSTTGESVICDPSGNVYLAGTTGTTSGIATPGAHQTTLSGTADDFLAKFDASGVLQWSTYYGGSDEEFIWHGLATDPAGNVFLFGQTRSTDAASITTPGCHQPVNGDAGAAVDAFIAKFSPAGVRLWGTYYGGNSEEGSREIKTDALGDVYICGHTTSTTNMATPGAHMTTPSPTFGFTKDGFAAKFSNSGTRIWGTYFGAQLDEEVTAIVPAGGNAYVCGWTTSTTALATVGSGDEVMGIIGADAFFAGFDNSGGLLFARYFGGDDEEYNMDLAADAGGNIYMAGSSLSPTDIATPGAFRTSRGIIGAYDGFLAKFDICTAAPVVPAITGMLSVCVGSSVTVSNSFPGGTWSSGSALITVGSSTGSVTAINSGTATITYTASNTCGTTNVTAVITSDTLAGSISGSNIICVAATTTLANPTSGGIWSSTNTTVATVSGAGLVTGIAPGTATISYAVSNSCGASSAAHTVTVDPAPFAGTISGATSVCELSATTLTTSGIGGVWSSTNTAVATITGAGVVSGIAPGTTTISYTVVNSCATVAATSVFTVNTLTPTAGTISGSSLVCTSLSVPLSSTATGGVWTSSATSVATISSTGTVTGITSGTATISYTVNNGCGSAVSTMTLTVDPAPSAGTITGPASVCVLAAISLTDATTGGVWSSSATTIATVSSTGLVSGIAAGTATISYAVSAACGSVAATHVITVNPPPAVAAIAGPATVCLSATAAYTDATPSGTWSVSPGTIAGISSTGVVTGLAVGTATVSYTVITACGTAVATTVIAVLAPPTAGVITGSSSVCVLGSISLTDATTGGVWSSSNPTIASVTAGGLVTGLVVGTADISYTVTNSCTSSSAVKTVTVDPTVTATPITGISSVCGISPITLSNATMGGSWISGNTAIATVSGGVVTPAATGAVTIYYSVASSCGGTVVSRSVTFNPLPTPVVTVSGAILSTTPKYISYQWLNSGIPVSGATAAIYVAPGSGTYAVQVTDSSGCTNISPAVTVVPAGVGQPVTVAHMAIQPNPNDGSFALEVLTPVTQPAYIVVTNAIGQVVKELTVTTNSNAHIVLDRIPGLYLLTVTTGTDRFVEKVIVH